MRIHGIQLRGLETLAGDHQLGLDPAYTVLRLPDPESARRLLALTRALLHPESGDAARCASQGRAVLTLALRSDACLVAADFARGRISLGRHDVKGSGYKALSSDAHEIEEYMLAVGLPTAGDFARLHVCGAAPGVGTPAARRDDTLPPARRAAQVAREARERAAAEARERAAARRAEIEQATAERARLLGEHEQQVLALATERARRESALEAALAAARADRTRAEERLRELRALDQEQAALEREHQATLAEVEKGAALTDSEDFEARVTSFRALAAQREQDRIAIDEARRELLAERARLRGAPRRQVVPIALGLALGAAGAAAGAVGYRLGYALAAAGVAALVAALGATRLAQLRVERVEALLAALRVRERTSERRFETEGAQVRAVMMALGTDSVDALSDAAHRFAEQVELCEQQKRRLAELAVRFPPEAREELARLEQERAQGGAAAAVRAARDALLELPADVPPPTLPLIVSAPPAPEDELPPEADTAVELDDADAEKEDDEQPEPAPPAGPETLLATAAHVLGRSEAEVRARLGPVLPVYLRALTAGAFTNARATGSGWALRGAARDEQPFSALPDRERELVIVAVQLALLEALATDRRVPLLVGPDLPARGDTEKRALARALRRLSSVVQVVQLTADEAPWSEHATKVVSV